MTTQPAVRPRLRTILRRMLLEDACFYGTANPRMTTAEWRELSVLGVPVQWERPRHEGSIYYLDGCCTRREAELCVRLGVVTADEAAQVRTRTHTDYMDQRCQRVQGCPRQVRS